MNWKFWPTAGEPCLRHALLAVIGVVQMMLLTWPIWQPDGRGMAVIISQDPAKLFMRP